MSVSAPPLPVAVLASGRGSNLGALIDAQASGVLPIRIVLVAGDRADAFALQRARDAGIATCALNPKDFANRAAFDAALFARVAEAGPALVVLAGYMRVIDADVVRGFAGRMINIHPSLLPKYRGLHTHRRALEAGDAMHGASVHFVTAELDGGPTIAQAEIPVHPGDTPESLAGRLLEQEHHLLVACVARIAEGRITLSGDRVMLDGSPLTAPLRLHETLPSLLQERSRPAAS
jgi:phosphoribosylglycinamide formyltransferase-1